MEGTQAVHSRVRRGKAKFATGVALAAFAISIFLASFFLIGR